MKCCNIEVKEYSKKMYLLDTAKYTDRIIYIGYCANPKCRTKVAELVQYNQTTERYEREKPKRKDVDAWIRAYENEPYRENIEEPKFGPYANMNWVNGVTTKDSEFAVDFNNIIRLVKTTKIKIFKEYKRNNLLYFNKDFEGGRTLVPSL
jgi:hypothetical protein